MRMESVQGRLWMLLVYKVPREPTSSRAYVWRKLKKLGAVLLHDAVWVLPATAWTREQLQWLSVEYGNYLRATRYAICWSLNSKNVARHKLYSSVKNHLFHLTKEATVTTRETTKV